MSLCARPAPERERRQRAGRGQGGTGVSRNETRVEAAPRVRAAVRVARVAKRVRADLPLGAFDALLTIVAYLAVLVLRFDGSVPHTYWHGFRDFTAAALVAHLGSNWACGLYRQMWRHASVQEARRVIAAGGLAALVLAPVY